MPHSEPQIRKAAAAKDAAAKDAAAAAAGGAGAGSSDEDNEDLEALFDGVQDEDAARSEQQRMADLIRQAPTTSVEVAQRDEEKASCCCALCLMRRCAQHCYMVASSYCFHAGTHERSGKDRCAAVFQCFNGSAIVHALVTHVCCSGHQQVAHFIFIG